MARDWVTLWPPSTGSPFPSLVHLIIPCDVDTKADEAFLQFVQAYRERSDNLRDLVIMSNASVHSLPRRQPAVSEQYSSPVTYADQHIDSHAPNAHNSSIPLFDSILEEHLGTEGTNTIISISKNRSLHSLKSLTLTGTTSSSHHHQTATSPCRRCAPSFRRSTRAASPCCGSSVCRVGCEKCVTRQKSAYLR